MAALARAKPLYEVQQDLYKDQPECHLWNEEQCKLHEKFQRYLTTAERAFERAFHDIERLRCVALRQHDVEFREHIQLRYFALKEQKHELGTTLMLAKIDLCVAKTVAQTTSGPVPLRPQPGAPSS